MVALVPYFFQIACVLNLKKDFKDPSPLIFSKNGYNSKYHIVLPSEGDGTAHLNATDEILMLCPESSVSVNGNSYATTRGKKGVLEALCNENIEPIFSSNRKSNQEQKTFITCKKYPKPHARKSSGNPCPRFFDKYTIDITVDDDISVNILTLCYEPNDHKTFYVQHTLYPEIKWAQPAKRPGSWTEENVYNLPISLKELYKKKMHQRTINTILGLAPNSSKYISLNERGIFLSKGHLSPKADHIYGAAQSLTFHYLNSAPQWSSFNEGNWLILEKQVRTFSAKRRTELIVYTGTYGTSTLPDINGQQQELYLYIDENNNRAIPVPKYFWKIIYDPASRQGISFIGVNNPFSFNKKTDILCEDICNQINWPKNKHAHNVTKGYLYCCDINDLRKSIPNIPNHFKVDYLLD